MKIRNVLWVGICLTFCATAQGSEEIRFGNGDSDTAIRMPVEFGDSRDPVEVVPRVIPRIINMLDFLVPPQSTDSEKQFYLEGYMECLQVPGSGCFVGGMSRYSRGGFQKQIKVAPDENGNIRFTSSKARTGLVAHPCEYHETRNEYDEYGQPVTILYLRAETMDWVQNKKYRAYYDGLGEPLFEWGRSNAVVGKMYVQDPGFEVAYECDNTVKTNPIMPAGYIVRVYSLEGDLDEVNRRMGSIGPVEPKWVGMAHEMGQKAELLVIEGYWGWTPNSPGSEPWRWTYRELYMYLKGVGWVSWRWQEHEGGDLHKPFMTHQLGNLDTIVWEMPGEFIRNVELCEPLN